MTPSDLLYSIETEILKDIAAELFRGAVGSAAWKSDRLLRLGVISERAAELIAKYAEEVRLGTASEVEKAAIDAALEVDAKAFAAKKAGAEVKDLMAIISDPVLKTTIEKWKNSAENQMNLAMAKMAENAGQVYSDIVNRTTLSVVSGAVDGHKALVTTIREWAEAGIPSIIDKAGRQWTSEAYVNAVLRSNASRAANESALARAEEYETDLVEVSSHPGSRPSHFEYQGQVYSRSGNNQNYPALAETGYGDGGGGLGSINCGHILYPFWEGVSIQRGPTQTEEENAALYQESQDQRALERAIRASKRELDVMQKTGDENAIREAKQAVRDRQREMRDFVEATGRTRLYGREQIYDR